MVSTGGTQGNISDLGGYYNELVYFTQHAAGRKQVEEELSLPLQHHLSSF